MCDSMARLPGNHKFQQRVEFATAFRKWFGKKWYIVAQVAFVLCLMSQTLASIIYTAQVRACVPVCVSAVPASFATAAESQW